MKESIDLSSQFKPKGKIKVELMDSGGEVIEKQETENFISKAVQRFYDELMRDVFTYDRAVGKYRYSDIHFDLFNALELTDATHPEDPQNEWIRAGNVIGYAYTTGTYSGSDTRRGSYNTSESFTNREQVHIVVDFPTHAGNGTFQSIYFMGGRGRLENDTYSKFGGTNYYKIVKHNGVVYAFSSERSNSNLYILDESTFNRIETIPLGNYYYDFCFVGNKIYFIKNNEVYSADISNPSESTLEKDDVSSSHGINYNPTTGRWFLSRNGAIDMYDSDWNLLSSYTGISYGSESYNYNKIVAVTEEGIITSFRQFIYIGGTYDGQIVPLATYHRLAGVVDDFLLYANESSDRYDGIYRIPLSNIGSRALLDSPVIKTSNNTMKITYDFMLPPQ